MSKWPRIAGNLIGNSIEAMYCAIELHNKPILKYRYETCSILMVNAWELLIKAYLYQIVKDKGVIKYLKKSLQDQKKSITDRLNEDTEWKSWFLSLVDRVFIGKENKVISQNLRCVAKLRNDFAHAYIQELNPILYSLMCKCVIEYQKFLKRHFKKDLWSHSDLILLPIGFDKPINVVDYLSWWTSIRTSKLVKEIYQICEELKNEGINDSILVNFHVTMSSANKVVNPDIIAALSHDGILINKNITNRFDPLWNPVGSIPVEELEKIFVIPAKWISGMVKEKTGLKIGKTYQSVYKTYKDNIYHQKYWWKRPDTSRILWSQDWLDLLISEFLKRSK